MTVLEKRKTVKKAADNAVQKIRRDITILYYAYGDPRTPWYAKAASAAVLGYALSPIDLIPDFIPIIGYIDDLLIIPAGLFFILKMIPDEVLLEAKIKADLTINLPVNYKAAALIALIWCIFIVVIIYFVIVYFK